MKYKINTYDAVKDVANVTLKFKYKTVDQTVDVRAHNVPVDDKELMDAWALGYVQGVKNEMKETDVRTTKTIATAIVNEQTVTEQAE